MLPVGDIVVYVIMNGIICHAELNLIQYRCSERSAEVKEIVDLTSTPPLGLRGLFKGDLYLFFTVLFNDAVPVPRFITSIDDAR